MIFASCTLLQAEACRPVADTVPVDLGRNCLRALPLKECLGCPCIRTPKTDCRTTHALACVARIGYLQVRIKRQPDHQPSSRLLPAVSARPEGPGRRTSATSCRFSLPGICTCSRVRSGMATFHPGSRYLLQGGAFAPLLGPGDSGGATGAGQIGKICSPPNIWE